MLQTEFLISACPKSTPPTAFFNSVDVKSILPVSQLNNLESFFISLFTLFPTGTLANLSLKTYPESDPFLPHWRLSHWMTRRHLSLDHSSRQVTLPPPLPPSGPFPTQRSEQAFEKRSHFMSSHHSKPSPVVAHSLKVKAEVVTMAYKSFHGSPTHPLTFYLLSRAASVSAILASLLFIKHMTRCTSGNLTAFAVASAECSSSGEPLPHLLQVTTQISPPGWSVPWLHYLVL